MEEKICSMKLRGNDMEDLMVFGIAFMEIRFVAYILLFYDLKSNIIINFILNLDCIQTMK